MKGTALLLLCAITVVQAAQPRLTLSGKVCHCNPGEADNVCSQNGSDNELIVHENCNQFYKCGNGKPVAYYCPGITLYNPIAEVCDWPQNVDCGDRPIVAPPEDESQESSNNSGEGNGQHNGTCNSNPEEAPALCAAAGAESVYVAHENCNQFYQCANGVPVTQNCALGLVYNPCIQQCDWPFNVDCGDRPIIEIESGGNSNEDCDENDNNGSENESTCNCDPEEAPRICQASGSDGTLVAHENCHQFYICDHGVPTVQSCAANLLYDPYTKRCDWPQNVECGDRFVVDCCNGNGAGEDEDCDGTGNETGDNGSGGTTGGNESSDTDNESSDDNSTDSGGTDNGGGTCNCNPGEAPGICTADDSDGILIAHENCNQFYKCTNGEPVGLFCQVNLVYNPYTQQCDWPDNVDCGDKPIVEIDEGSGDNGDSDGDCEDGDSEDSDNGGGTCNCNPGEAPGICAADGSDGILIAHENCNQFYKCSNGEPVGLFCPVNLVYNAFTQKCDWPENVDCGDKPIVEIEEGGGDNGSEDNESVDSGDSDNGSGTCNCNPGEAPGICAADDSDGILIAHENCNQFYKCANGKPVGLFCQNNLVYNPYTQQCDWPDNVDCGDKPIVEVDEGSGDNGDSDGDCEDGDSGDSDNGSGTCNCNPGEAPGICAADGSDGILIAHENCNQFYKCYNGEPVGLFCPVNLVYNAFTQKCDWPENVDCGDKPIVEIEEGGGDNGSEDNESVDSGDSDNGGGTCNCNPGEAPGICAADGSEGILIAHENCNQFYKCSNGEPVGLFCPVNLVYNPYTQQCDWPDNVDCGDKPIVEVDEGSGDNGDSEDGESGDNDNGGGTCNCSPGEAPGICAADGSDGVLIAHENCNQFYKCSNGEPVAVFCPDNLLYQPQTQKCDWPENVGCGDKPIAEIDGGSDNDDEDNEDVDNDDKNVSGNDENSSVVDEDCEESENGNTCNCNPNEAANICGRPGSDGSFVAHENCNQFYQCAHGVPVAVFCAAGLLYNPHLQRCTWPNLVLCEERPIVENDAGSDNNESNEDVDDSDNGDNGESTCNCNPDEAPAICSAAGSDGTFIAHENCNQFYMCSNSLPVAVFCSGNLLYNAQAQRCDWPSTVTCGERPIVEVGPGENEGDKSDESTDIEGACDPSQAPTICSSPGSDGILVAHENCHQFYVCSHGAPNTVNCPSNLFYNHNTKDCDWPTNVDCGDRIIPDGGDNDGPCACDARQAPSICAGENSNGKLIAHENCGQYYVCFEGTPVARSCPMNLYYDPNTERCIWPSSVNCGGRFITPTSAFSSLNKHLQARRGFL